MNSRRKQGNDINQHIKLCCQPVLRAFKDVPFCSYLYHSKKNTTDCRKLDFKLPGIWNFCTGAIISALTDKFQASLLFLTPVLFALSENTLPAGAGGSEFVQSPGLVNGKGRHPLSPSTPVIHSSPTTCSINAPSNILEETKMSRDIECA